MVVKGVGWGGGVTLWRHCGTRHVASGWSCGSLPLEGVVSRFSVKAAAAAAVTNMVLLSHVSELYSRLFSPCRTILWRFLFQTRHCLTPISLPLFYACKQDLLLFSICKCLKRVIKKRVFNGDSLKRKDRARSCIAKHGKTFIGVTTEPLVTGSAKSHFFIIIYCLSFPYCFFFFKLPLRTGRELSGSGIRSQMWLT